MSIRGSDNLHPGIEVCGNKTAPVSSWESHETGCPNNRSLRIIIAAADKTYWKYPNQTSAEPVCPAMQRRQKLQSVVKEYLLNCPFCTKFLKVISDCCPYVKLIRTGEIVRQTQELWNHMEEIQRYKTEYQIKIQTGC